MQRTWVLLLAGLLMAGSTWGQQAPEVPAAPVPPQIADAKKVFISNDGEETIFRLPKDAMYAGGPNRAYNQFYAAMKSWGRYEVVASPADADLVLAVGFMDKHQGPVFVSQIKVVVIDPKTRIALWTLTKYVEPAGMAKNREKNYNSALNAVVEDVKSLVAAPASK